MTEAGTINTSDNEYRIFITDFLHFYYQFLILAAVSDSSPDQQTIGEVDVFCLGGFVRHSAQSVTCQSGLLDREAMFSILRDSSRGMIEKMRVIDAEKENNPDIRTDVLCIRPVPDASTWIPNLVYGHNEYLQQVKRISKSSVSEELRKRLQFALAMNIEFRDLER